MLLSTVNQKSKIVWRSLVDVKAVKAAKQKLQDINWLYKAVDNDAVDDTAKRVIEVANNATSKMLEKASKDNAAVFQSYTIVNMQGKISTESDIDKFKLLNVKEQPLDNRLKYLYVMCFPVLFPNGQFGQYYPRTVQISHNEYVKSRLLNKDSRFRKDPQYVFYLLFSKANARAIIRRVQFVELN